MITTTVSALICPLIAFKWEIIIRVFKRTKGAFLLFFPTVLGYVSMFLARVASEIGYFAGVHLISGFSL